MAGAAGKGDGRTGGGALGERGRVPTGKAAVRPATAAAVAHTGKAGGGGLGGVSQREVEASGLQPQPGPQQP